MKKNIFLIIGIIAITGLIYYQTRNEANPSDTVSPGGELASVHEIDIMILESFPVQVRVVARGVLPNSCYEIGDINEIRQERHFEVKIKQNMVAEICAQALVPFEESFPLSVNGLKAGEYSVNVNGVEDKFTLDIDNSLPDGGQNNSGDTPVLPPGY